VTRPNPKKGKKAKKKQKKDKNLLPFTYGKLPETKGKKMNQLFIYANHTMRANIEGDAQLVVESLRAQPLKHGIYPVNFAEGEAYDLLEQLMETVHCDTIAEADAELQKKVALLIEKKVFDSLESLNDWVDVDKF
jgi:hypothetical protein